jgi:hypothetical protein
MLDEAGAGAGRCTGAGRWEETGAAPDLVAGAPVAGAGAEAIFAGAAAVGGGPKEGLGAPVGPPGGSVGNLMVGAAVGLGGKLMRTVSFLGCTLPVDFLSGSAPVGAPGSGLFGGKSAILLK